MLHTDTRPETIGAALLHLITAYHRCRCPGLAACIARHFQVLRGHPRADRLLPDVAAASIAQWETAAREVPKPVTAKSGFFGFTLH